VPGVLTDELDQVRGEPERQRHMEVELAANIATTLIKLLAIPSLGYIVYFVIRIEKCLSTIKAQLVARTAHCKGRGNWMAETHETASKNHTNIATIAANLGLSGDMEH